jgi:hypothetical protein
MTESLDIVENKDKPITTRKSGNGAVNGQAIDGAGLCQVTGTEAAPQVLFRNVGRQLIE